jgi:hypothetical protein
MEVQRNSARYLEGRQLADAYMRGRTNATVQGTVRKRSAELRTSQEQVDLTQGYNDRIREISNMSMDEIGKLMGLYKS